MRYINRSFRDWVGRFYFILCQGGCHSLERVFSYPKRKLGMFFTVLDIVTSVTVLAYI